MSSHCNLLATSSKVNILRPLCHNDNLTTLRVARHPPGDKLRLTINYKPLALIAEESVSVVVITTRAQGALPVRSLWHVGGFALVNHLEKGPTGSLNSKRLRTQPPRRFESKCNGCTALRS